MTTRLEDSFSASPLHPPHLHNNGHNSNYPDIHHGHKHTFDHPQNSNEATISNTYSTPIHKFPSIVSTEISTPNNTNQPFSNSTSLSNFTTHISPTHESTHKTTPTSTLTTLSPFTITHIAKKQEESSHVLPEREQWSSKLDFIFTFLGYSIGLGNMWRFPYICYKNGGGAFLIPYFLTCLLAGLPSIFLELSLGQYLSVGGLGVWRITPAFKGVGYASLITATWCSVYYVVVLAWAIFYLYYSFRSPLPWSTCSNPWNTPYCKSSYGHLLNSSSTQGWNLTCGEMGKEKGCEVGRNTTTPVQEFWENKVLMMSGGIEEVGTINWQMAVALLVAWITCYFCIWKGVKWTGKVTWVTSTLPYVFLLILFFRGVTLPGALEGIVFYLKPDFTKLTKTEVWNDAATQVFFSYCLALGSQIALGSYNPYHNNILKDSIILSCVNSCTSLFAGFVIFSVLGFMAQEQGKSVADVVKSGPGLAFLAYPSAISQMPLSPLWAVLFFLTLFFVGLDSQFCMVEGVITALADEWPQKFRRHKRLVTLIFCIVCCLLGLSLVTEGGIYVFQLLGHFTASGPAVMVLVFFDCIAISWAYGVTRYTDAISHMIGYHPGRWWNVCWAFLTPVFVLINFFLAMVLYKQPTVGSYTFPTWALGVGWLVMFSSLSCIPLYAIYAFYTASGSFTQRMRKICRPYVPDEPLNRLREGRVEEMDKLSRL